MNRKRNKPLLDLLKKILGKNIHPRWLLLFACMIMLSSFGCGTITLNLDPPDISKIEGEGFGFYMSVDEDSRAEDRTAAFHYIVDWSVVATGGNSADVNDFSGNVYPGGELRFVTHARGRGFWVSVSGDTTVEPDETFVVQLDDFRLDRELHGLVFGPKLEIGRGVSVGTILNDDNPLVQVNISAVNAEQTEGDSGSKEFTFKAELSNACPLPVSVDWSVAGIGGNPADADDFEGSVFPGGSLVFEPDEVLKNIQVSVSGDTTVEPDEAFTVTLRNPGSGAVIDTNRASAAGTILDDDEPIEPQPAEPVLKDISARLIRVVPLSGVNPFEFNSLSSNINTGALTVVGTTLPLLDDDADAFGATTIYIVIDPNGIGTNTLKAVIASSFPSQAAFSMTGTGGPDTATLSSGSSFTLINPTSGSTISVGSNRIVVKRNSDSSFFQVTVNFDNEVALDPGDTNLKSLSGFNCGLSQTNCP